MRHGQMGCTGASVQRFYMGEEEGVYEWNET